MTNAKSLWHINSHESAILEGPLNPGPGHVELQALYSLISPGTERIVATGQVPRSMYEVMRVPYMDGGFDFPVKYGYSMVARSLEGKNYHLLHPHQDLISADPASLTELPENLPLWKAGLISNLETALTAYWDGAPHLRDKILLVGFGWIGSLIAGVLKLKGCHDLWVAESLPARAELARRFGFQVINSNDATGLEFDLTFHSSSTAEGLQTCLDSLKPEGRVIEVSWYGNRASTLNLGENFHYKRLTIQSSQVSRIPLKMQADWDIKKRKVEVLRLLDDAWWDQYQIPFVPFEDSPNIFDQLRNNKSVGLTCLLKY